MVTAVVDVGKADGVAEQSVWTAGLWIIESLEAVTVTGGQDPDCEKSGGESR